MNPPSTGVRRPTDRKEFLAGSCHPIAKREPRQKEARPTQGWSALRKPGDNLLSRISTIIGGGCLTTVFGMGTGMARHLWSPGILYLGGSAVRRPPR